MKASQVIDEVVGQNDPNKEYIETIQKLRPETAARIQAHHDRFTKSSQENLPNSFFSRPDTGQDVRITLGGIPYFREGGTWYRRVRRKNPAYFDQSNYFFISGDAGIVLCKQSRRITTRAYRKAFGGIARELAGRGVNTHDWAVDGVDQKEFDSAVETGKYPAYEIELDGSFRRVN